MTIRLEFTKFADQVLSVTYSMRQAQKMRRGLIPATPEDLTVWCRMPHKRHLRELLTEQPAGMIFMLAAVVAIGAPEEDRDFDLLDVYCDVSDACWTPRRAVERLMRTKQLFDHLYRGLDRLEEKGIAIDRWMA
jgi:hypothetical protein